MGDKRQTTEPPPKQTDKAYLWKWTAVIALLALLTTGSWNLYQLYAHIASGPRVVIAADYNTFTLPPQLTATIPDKTRQKLDRLRGQLNATLRNVGDLPANSARIQIKSKGVAFLKWDDGKAEEKDFTTDVQIGDLPIGKSLSVSLWLEDTLSPDSDKPLVIHNTGATSIELPQKRQPPSMATWLLGRVTAILPIAFAVLMLVLMSQSKKRTDRMFALASAFAKEAEAATRVATTQVEACSACRGDPARATVQLMERDQALLGFRQAHARETKLTSDSVEAPLRIGETIEKDDNA